MGGKLIYELIKASVVEGARINDLEDGISSSHAGKSFLSGILIQASSPKNIALYAIIPQFIDPGQNTFFQFLALCVVSVLIELPVLTGYASLASKFARKIYENGYRNVLDGISALYLIGIALSLFWSASKKYSSIN